MKYLLLLSVMFLTTFSSFSQVTHVVQANGFAYSPATLTINLGDSVRFEAGASHPTRQVSSDTWDAKGTTLLAGGFDFPSGNGTVGFDQPGTYFYVCTAHVASHGMKGKIIVQAATPVNAVSDESVRIYPVPLKGNELSVEWKLPVKSAIIQVFSLSGSLVINLRHEMVSGVSTIDCSKLPSGMYLLKLQSDDVLKEFKFLKE
ncbi:MAG TPA: T9SS type A sorting domain-containing protein [Bacteroidales bacterium]|nr:T9SS type A sorting domain-containing protein [Bacteroidales bacterium]